MYMFSIFCIIKLEKGLLTSLPLLLFFSLLSNMVIFISNKKNVQVIT